MARKIQEIRQDLTKLEDKVANIHDNLIYFYGEYVDILCSSIKKQLILASYQVSTQKYPEQFLKLSFSHREKFQKKIKEIAPNFKSESQDLAKQLLQNIVTQLQQEDEDKETDEGEIIKQQESVAVKEAEEESVNKITNPDELAFWQESLEVQIRELLDHVSNQANQILQSYNIIPNKLPAKLLEMAIKAEEKGSPMTGPPNLLNVLIEAKNNDKPEDATITPVTAIHLRLSELEFADTQLSNQRHQIRNLLADLASIKQKYKKLKRELAIAEAESAWRSSWYEE